MLSGWQPLPLCSPLGAEASHTSGSTWRNGGPAPTALVRSGRCYASNSAASIYDPATEEPRPKPLLPSAQSGKASSSDQGAVEELLNIGLEYSPSWLKHISSLLLAIHGLLKRDVAIVAEGMQAARLTLDADGIEAPSFEAPIANNDAAAETSAGNHVFSPALPWCIVPPDFRALVRQGAVASGEVGFLVLQSSDFGEAWDRVERGLVIITTMVRRCVDAIREIPSNGAEASAAGPFSAMSHGVPMLWLFLNEFAMVLIPVVLWCTTTMPKGSGKKAKEGQEALHTARVATKNFLAHSRQHSQISRAILVELQILQ